MYKEILAPKHLLPFYYSWKINNRNKNFNIIFYYIFKNDFNIEKLINSIQILVNKRPSLRSTYIEENNEIKIRFYDNLSPIINKIFVNNIDEYNETLKNLYEISQNIIDTSLIKVTIIKKNYLDETVVLFDLYHSIIDGFSLNYFVNNLSDIYNDNYVSDVVIDEYLNYLISYNKLFDNYNNNEFEEYFKLVKKISNENKNDLICTSDNVIYSKKIVENELYNSIKLFCKENNISVFNFFILVFGIFESKLTRKQNILISYPVNTRKVEQIEGYFVNTIYYPFEYNGNNSIISYIQKFNSQILGLKNLKNVDLSKYLGNIVCSCFSYPSISNMYPLKIDGDEIEGFGLPQLANSNFAIKYREYNNKFYFSVEFYKDFCSEYLLENIIDRFLNLIQNIILRPKNPVSSFDILLDESEKKKLLNEFNETAWEYPRESNLVLEFEKVVERYPKSIAIFYAGEYLIYEELNSRSNYISKILHERIREQKSIVGILLNRGLNTLVSIIGVLKSGCSYMPIDPVHPLNRIKYMLENGKVRTLISEAPFIDRIEFTGEIIDIRVIKTKEYVSNPKSVRSAEDTACILYTSGSTGLPKGVVLSDRNILNVSYYYMREREIKANENIAEHASIGFDAAIIGIYPVLFAGATIHIIPEEIRLSLDLIDKYFLDHDINGAFFTTQLGEQYSEYYEGKSLRFLDVGGEKLKKYVKRNFNLKNLYGPTEGCVFVTDYNVQDESRNISIGKPISNIKIYILDSDLNLCPIGVYGELYITGDSLSEGYLNNAEQTEKCFIKNIYQNDTEKENGKNSKMYKTGDLARYLLDGNIEILGRADFQVKINGYRIETSEIESQLLKYPGVKNALVVCHEREESSKSLCAYYVSESKIDQQDLQLYLSNNLPTYMLPKVLIHLNNFPLNRNGKIDRTLLPVPNYMEQSSSNYVAPETEQEKLLAEAFSEVLGIEKIGVHDDFFSLGGDSIKAVRLVLKLKKYFIIDTGLIFKYRNINLLIKNINFNIINDQTIIVENKREYFPLTIQQKRIISASLTSNIFNLYDINYKIKIFGKLNKEKLGGSIDNLFSRHLILKSYFKIKNNEISVCSNDEFVFKKEYQNNYNIKEKKLKIDFDLFSPPLVKISLNKVSDIEYDLLFSTHHSIFDGSSIDILMRDLIYLYDGKNLCSLPFQYRDYAVWQSENFKNGYLNKQELYWLSNFEGQNTDRVKIPYDYPSSENVSSKGDNITIELPDNLIEKITSYSKSNYITLNSFFFSCFFILLYKYTNQNTLIVGTATQGRSIENTDLLIGMFVNSLPIIANIDKNMNVDFFIREIQDNLILALQNQDYPIENLTEKLNIIKSPGKNLLFDIFFNYLNIKKEYNSKNLVFSVQCEEMKIAKFDITLTCIESDCKINLEFNYKTSLFNKNTILNMANNFLNVIKSIINSNNLLIKQISILSESEKKKLLNEFNETAREYPRESNLVLEFEKVVERYPKSIAIFYAGEYLIYEELNSRSNYISKILHERIREQKSIVGILLNRGLNTLVSIIGVLKSGCSYMPIDPVHPLNRIKYMLENGKVRTLISEAPFIDRIEFTGEIIDIRVIKNKEYVSNPKNVRSAEDTACILYTSGSTGLPKGVVLSDRNILNVSYYYMREREIKANENIAEHASIGFDAAIIGIYPVLFAGATIHIIPEEIRLSLDLIDKYFLDHDIKGVSFTTQLGEQYSEYYEGKSLRFLDVGGEKLKKYVKRNYKLLNAYGPTEGCVFVTDYNVQDESRNISIGKPISNIKIYILDSDLNLCPIGVYGELYITGDSLSEGYLNNAEQTEKCFIKNIYQNDTEKENGKNSKMYKTGDLARYLLDGNIEILGRADFQVKINGYRIETSEIESHLLKYPGVKNALVVCHEREESSKSLCAYYVSESKIDQQDLQLYLSNNLPTYMLPKVLIHLNNFPLNRNGKIDRTLLPVPNYMEQSSSNYVAPETEQEKLLAEAFSEVLGIEKIGVHDDFFSLGGDSIKAIKLLTKIQKYFEANISQIFNLKTVKMLSIQLNFSKDSLTLRIKNIKERFIENINELSNDELNKIKLETDCYLNKNTRLFKLDLNEIKEIECVLITGSTGYLGIHILKELINNSRYKICLIIRGKNLNESEDKINKFYKYYFNENLLENHSDRVQVYNGDLEKLNFNLNEYDYNELSKNVHSIIHAAATVKHYGEYKMFYNSNVLSTMNILEFAKKSYIKDVHYISTYSVCTNGYIDGVKNIIMTEYDFPNKFIINNNYVKTKFESEELCLKERNNGLNISIYRVGNLFMNSSAKVHQINIDENASYSLIKSFINIGVFPEIFSRYEVSPIDDTARAIVLLFNKSNLNNEVYHLYNHNKYDFCSLFKKIGINFNILNINDFLLFIEENMYKKTFQEYIEKIMLHLGWSDNYKDKKYTNVKLLQEKTNYILNKLKFSWSKIEDKHIIFLAEKIFSERIQFTKKIEFIKNSNESTIDNLVFKTKLHEYKVGESINRNGLISNEIYIILRGFVEVSIITFGGWIGTISVLKEGDIFNFDSILNKPSYLGYEAIIEDVTILSINKDDLLSLMQSDFNLSLAIIENINNFNFRLVKLLSMFE